jgi:hypothetical protein
MLDDCGSPIPLQGRPVRVALFPQENDDVVTFCWVEVGEREGPKRLMSCGPCERFNSTSIWSVQHVGRFSRDHLESHAESAGHQNAMKQVGDKWCPTSTHRATICNNSVCVRLNPRSTAHDPCLMALPLAALLQPSQSTLENLHPMSYGAGEQSLSKPELIEIFSSISDEMETTRNASVKEATASGFFDEGVLV